MATSREDRLSLRTGLALSRRAAIAALFPAMLAVRVAAGTTAVTGRPLAVSRLQVRDFGVRGDGSDETLLVQAAVAGAIAHAPSILSFDGLTLRIDVIDVSGADEVVLDGGGATVVPTGQTGGRFRGENFGTLDFSGFRFLHRPGWNYRPAIELKGGRRILIRDSRFEGCGFGAHVHSVDTVAFDSIVLHQIGIYPRPRPLDPSPKGFAAAFEVYGGGLRAAYCKRVTFGDAIEFHNDLPAGGHLKDETGGPGGCSTWACDDVLFGAGTVTNAPGQGFCAAGEWQNRDVVGLLRANRFDNGERGRRVTFRGSQASGCNQEGCTAYGMIDVRFENVQASNNRYADIEIWQCWRAHVSGGRVWEHPSVSHPLRSTGALGGLAAVHVMDSSDVLIEGLDLQQSRHSGINVGGSQRVVIRNCRIQNYGQDDGVSYMASGVACTAGSFGRNAEDVAIGPGNLFARPSMRNNSGSDLFAQDPSQRLYAWNNRADARAISYGNASQAFRARPSSFEVAAPRQ